ncbi:hypothetical protein [Cytobacillus purgationiresistens]|uniref:Lipoprotein n=1 Tax=Cytobacillus purgationiresistens TaxID=863449 RepID=A0ABU0ATF4_9BACI|nr:hypothetical protein [Cytobacillus purgationiresistens]MDQ0273320.1 hypothetical protein [Cytobacillus purgationiresistens]
MKKMRFFLKGRFICSLIILLIACERENLPGTRAYQDEFTREFLQSPEEIEEGFYQFKSKTEGYTMWFPKDAKVSEAGFESNQDVFETFSFGEQVKKENLSFYYKITYNQNVLTDDSEIYLESLSSYAGFDGNYETF